MNYYGMIVPDMPNRDYYQEHPLINSHWDYIQEVVNFYDSYQNSWLRIVDTNIYVMFLLIVMWGGLKEIAIECIFAGNNKVMSAFSVGISLILLIVLKTSMNIKE